MKIKARTENGERIELYCEIIHITGKDNMLYRIKDDKEHGLEILVEYGRAFIEPHVSNEITIFTRE